MKPARILYILIILIFAFTSPVISQAPGEVVEDTTYTNRLTLLPVLGSTADTSFMFGAVAMQQFKSRRPNEYPVGFCSREKNKRAVSDIRRGDLIEKRVVSSE